MQDQPNGQQAGWEFTVPKFLANPLIWVLIVGVIVFGAYKLFSGSGESSSTQAPVTQSTKQESSAQPKTLGFFKKVSDTPVSLENKPYFLYVGGQFCPFCAAERWSMVKALSNFGTWFRS